MLKALIVDDEPLALEVVAVFLKQIPDVEIVAQCTSAIEAFQALNKFSVDVIFLDIQMPALNGLDFIKSLTHKPKIVIISAFRNFGVECYELDVIDYLVKPITFARLLKAVHKVTQLMPSISEPVKTNTPEINKDTNTECVFIKADKKIHKVNQNDILYIESLKDYIRVKTAQETFITYCTLSNMTDKICSKKFLRIHRSFTVAIDKIKMVDGNFVVINGNYLPISRKMKPKVMDRLQQNTK